MKKHIAYTLSFVMVSTSPGYANGNTQGVEISALTTPSVADSSAGSSKANMMGQASNLITSGIMFNNARRAAASKNYGMAAMYAAMGALTLAQATAHKNSAYQSNITNGLATAGGSGYDPSSLEDVAGGASPEVRALSTNIKSLQDSGLLSKDLNTVKTPDGKEYKTSDFGSEASMKSAGVPSSAIGKGMSVVAAAAKKANELTEKVVLGSLTAANGYEEGGGSGGGSSYSGTSSDDSYSQGGAVAGAGVNSSDREPANLAGMQKDYNGEPIGIAADSIFLMVNRRYKVKEGQEAFFSEKDLLLKK